MVVCHKADVAVVLCLFVVRKIFVCKWFDITLAVRIENSMIAEFTVAEKSAVAVAVVVKIKVHVETCVVNCSFGIAPLCNHCGIRIFRVEHITHTTPDFCRCNFIVIVFNK